jgi:hypothetical protein
LIGVAATALVAWLAFGKLARDYELGLQTLSEASVLKPGQQARRRWIETLVHAPPLRWWLRDSVSRAGFLLTAAYLIRDRDVKLRVYPGLAPMMVMPLVFLIQGRNTGGFGLAFSGAYLGLIPLMGLTLLQYSQQWQASDLFRAAPLPGPAPLCHGARRAVLCLLGLPTLLFFAALGWWFPKESSQLALLLPGIIAVPIYALVPNLGGKGLPLSLPIEEAKSANRALSMIGVMLVSLALAGLATWSWVAGWFKWLLLGEIIVVACLYPVFRHWVTSARWPSME